MKTIALGDSGIDVSTLCLGILPFGTKVDRDTSFAILDAYYDAGGRFIDTANNYSKWHANGVGTESETVLGEWMAARRNRDDLVIATKVGFNRADIGPSLSRTTIEAESAGSLKRLQTDRIDLYYAHADIRSDPLDQTLRAFDALVRSGKVRAIGCSNYRAWRIAEARAHSAANGWASYCCVQQRHSYLRPRPGASFGAQTSSNEDLIDYCRERPEVRLLAYSPLLNGAYTRADRDFPRQYPGAETDARIAVLRRIAGDLGATENQVIYAWMLAGNPAVIPLTAPTTLDQLTENLGALTVALTEELVTELDTAGNP
ncbi:MAG: aldo/keto reductase [Spirochaetaceae bacterium]|nr:MAG: aldo/keto reductase [Spirochaetaceae bacterium]